MLKSQSEEIKNQYERELNDMAHALEQTEKECQMLKNDKAETEQYLEELQNRHE